jgi:hypothetical protein
MRFWIDRLKVLIFLVCFRHCSIFFQILSFWSGNGPGASGAMQYYSLLADSIVFTMWLTFPLVTFRVAKGIGPFVLTLRYDLLKQLFSESCKKLILAAWSRESQSHSHRGLLKKTSPASTIKINSKSPCTITLSILDSNLEFWRNSGQYWARPLKQCSNNHVSWKKASESSPPTPGRPKILNIGQSEHVYKK